MEYLSLVGSWSTRHRVYCDLAQMKLQIEFSVGGSCRSNSPLAESGRWAQPRWTVAHRDGRSVWGVTQAWPYASGATNRRRAETPPNRTACGIRKENESATASPCAAPHRAPCPFRVRRKAGPSEAAWRH